MVAKALTIAALSMALLLAMVGTAQAKSSGGKAKTETYTGVAVQVTKTHLTVEVTGDNNKTKRYPVQLSDATTYTGGELVQGANVTVTVKAGKAVSVDVAVAKK
jgi:acetolactate synthase small subunit